MAAGSNSRRGWLGLASICKSGTSATLPSRGSPEGGGAGFVAGRLGRRECSPLPSALRRLFLLMSQDFFRQLDISFGAAGSRIIHQNGFAVAGRLGEPDVAWNHSFENIFAEKFPEIGSHLPGKVGPVVE